jgi:uncharacterized OsmC-like protein
LGGALQARGIPTGGGRLRATAEGEVEKEDGVLILKRVSVRYSLAANPGVDRSVIDRVMGFHADRCPVARSIGGCVDIATQIEVIEGRDREP